MSPRNLACASLVFVALTFFLAGQVAHADPTKTPDGVGTNLQAPEQRSTRYSAYTLPRGMWGFEVGALGTSGHDLYSIFGVSYGFNHGFQLDVNFAHWAVGVLNVQTRWNFLDMRHFAVGAELGILYAHGAWVWPLDGAAQALVDDADLISLPISLIASAPVNRWLQFDLMVSYRHAVLIGEVHVGDSFFAETEIGARQLVFRPTSRLFLSHATALEFSVKLPVYNRVPYESDPTLTVRDNEYGEPRDGYAEVPFSKSWNVEVGLRSRLRQWLFATVSIQVGQIPKEVYGTSVSPTFGLEFRL